MKNAWSNPSRNFILVSVRVFEEILSRIPEKIHVLISGKVSAGYLHRRIPEGIVNGIPRKKKTRNYWKYFCRNSLRHCWRNNCWNPWRYLWKYTSMNPLRILCRSSTSYPWKISEQISGEISGRTHGAWRSSCRIH